MVVCGEQSIDALAHFCIARALPVEYGGALGGVGTIDGGQKRRLDQFGIDRHG
jgi:hypothetical protein